MPREALAKELKAIRERYRLGAFSLGIFVRNSLQGLDERRTKVLEVFDRLGAVPSSVGEPTSVLENLLADTLNIGGPHTRMLLEMSVAYAGALYDGVVSDVLITTFRNVPQALRSGRTLTTEEVLNFASREDLIEELARRDIHELTYKSAKEQFRYFRSVFGVDVFGRQSLDITVVDLAAVRERRNLVVHNNGLANAFYVENYCPGGAIGDSVIMDAESAKSDREVLRKVGIALINSFLDKFSPQAKK